MKKLKLFLATLLALVFAFSAGKVKAYDITVDNAGSGTYESYRIFTGTLSEDGKTLSNIKWGDGITEAGRTALQEKYKVSSAAALAEVIGAEGFTATQAEEFAKEAGKYLQNPGGLTGLTAGYYLVQNKTVGSNEAYTNYILEVVGNVTVTPKTDIPTLEKKVKDTNDSKGEETDWQDSADYDFDDDVPFQLTATLPSNFNSYDNYYFEISDTLSSGLTYNKDAKVYLVNDGQKKDITEMFTIETANGLSFKIDNLKAVSGVTASSKIVVEYTATLNKSAVIGKIGNPNTAKLIYSNNPNSRGTAGSTTETPEDTVIVFTYKVVVNKVDENSKLLAGAGFTLFKKVADAWKEVKTISAGEATTFTFSGLDDGVYKLSETTTPDGYNKIDDVEFTVTAEHDVLSDNPALTSLSGNAASGELAFTAAVTEGSLSTDVVNKKGATLPSTGGTGTRLLYVLGFILIFGAGILLVTKKRMDTK
ncbi:isopeptide-forming domain-containing fimbrial protein [Streptococcus ruminicola]|uniref:isopeptide-forming domain-containing fimbrial protein n=1 Tax=Streptococcus ruminicola TaxID=2686210 RepID=UPI0012F7FA39|nr:isopeptide-forming domain-containing fimbrial protein [Streptococcus ruminicola]QGX01439.1 isopeptide-forming domain-containing fimbrial protein [Streptococcus ruminicola]